MIQNICFQRMDAAYKNLNIFDHVHFSLHYIFQILIFIPRCICLLPLALHIGWRDGGRGELHGFVRTGRWGGGGAELRAGAGITREAPERKKNCRAEAEKRDTEAERGRKSPGKPPAAASVHRKEDPPPHPPCFHLCSLSPACCSRAAPVLIKTKVQDFILNA